jgi:predicted dehydrogenase
LEWTHELKREKMKPIQRRDFIKSSVTMAGGLAISPAYIPNMLTDSPNERVNVAVIGIAGERKRERGIINGRGISHIQAYSRIPNVKVKTICDVDERLFPDNVKIVEELFGSKPNTEPDFRKVLDDRDIDIVSLATPDHWHALQTVWACQAGKDVYVEKPVSHNVSEGRKMVEAVEKYNRIVQSGICYRSSTAVKEGIKMIHDGALGKVYMARGITFRYREPIGIFPDSPVPNGLHWDMFLGPAPYRPFNINRFLYHWHWFWDTGTAEIGNNGIYRMDTARWALNKNSHPVKIQCTGGLFGRDPKEQETPNIMDVSYVYDDGMIIQNEVRCLPTNSEGLPEDSGLRCFVYGDEGYMVIGPRSFKTYYGRRDEPGPAKSDDDLPPEERSNGYKNLVECVKSGRKEGLDNPMIEGHMSATLCHLGNIAYRGGGEQLFFDSNSERFISNPKADHYLARTYRAPYVMPEKI